MKFLRCCTILVFFISVCLTGSTQTKLVDSLLRLVYSAKGDQQKLEASLNLCNEYNSMARDTLDYYSFYARSLASQIKDKRLKDLAELAVAYDYMRWGWTDSVLFTVEPIIKENEINNTASRAIYFKACRLKAMSYAMHSRYQEGLTVLYKIVNEAEAYKDTLTLGENINTIGSIALARNQPRDALKWLSRALSLTTEAPRYRSIRAAVFVNMADAYAQLKKTDSANINIEKGILLFKQTENLTNLALAMQRQSDIFLAAGKTEAAEASLKELIALRRQSGDSALNIGDNLSLIDFYLQTKQIDKAIQFCKASLATGDLHNNSGSTKNFANNTNIRLEYYMALAKCYKLNGDDQLYQQTLEQIIVAKDSFYHYNSAAAIAELQTKYEVQLKENTIIQQSLDITRKNNRFYTFLGVALFIAVIAVLLFYEYKKRGKFKLNAMLEKEKLLAAQSVARAEETERKRIAADLHDNLGAYAASIVSNLDFIAAQSHHQLKEDAALHELRNNSQAIVSQLNDTIWALKREGLSLTAISDRIKIFMQRIQPSYPHIAINIIEQINEDQALTPAQAFHLFRIMQEAITNALKHSNAKEIVVYIESDNAGSNIKITDDGTGIKNAESIQKGGNGLANMQQRAKEAGWTITWSDNLPQGTSVNVASTTN